MTAVFFEAMFIYSNYCGLLMLLAGAAVAADFPATPAATTPHESRPSGNAMVRTPVTPKVAAARVARMVDINTADKSRLMKLPGITDADAAKIIAGRPYTSKADLVTRNILLRGQYESVKAVVMALPPARTTVQRKSGGPAVAPSVKP